MKYIPSAILRMVKVKKRRSYEARSKIDLAPVYKSEIYTSNDPAEDELLLSKTTKDTKEIVIIVEKHFRY